MILGFDTERGSTAKGRIRDSLEALGGYVDVDLSTEDCDWTVNDEGHLSSRHEERMVSSVRRRYRRIHKEEDDG